MRQRNTYRRTDPLGGIVLTRAMNVQAGMMHAKPLGIVTDVVITDTMVSVTLRNGQVIDYAPRSMVGLLEGWMV